MALTGLTSLAPLGARAGHLRFTPEEEDDWLGQLAGAGTSALGVIGDVLDTLGGPIRTALSGKDLDRVLASIVDPSQRVSGRQMLQDWGVVGENYEGLDWGDVAGFAAEVGTDPLTLVGGGTTKAGSIAKALGKFPKRSTFDVGTGALKLGKRAARRGTLSSVLEGAGDDVLKHAEQLAKDRGANLADLLNEPMQRSLGVGLPFRENAFTFDLPGAAGRAAALDKIGGYIRSTAPARYAAKLFDRQLNNAGDWTGQLFSKEAHAEFEPAQRAAGADINRFHLGLRDLGVGDQDLQSDILEGITRHPEAPRGTRLSERQILDYNVQPLAGESPEALEARKLAIGQIRRDFQASPEKLRLEREKVGLPAARFESQRIDYAPREATYPQYGKADPSKRRRDPLRELGRTEVDAILRDPQLQELSKQIEIDPLSPESLTQQVPDEVLDDLKGMGYEDIADLVPWQARNMRNADPQREAWNALAEGASYPPGTVFHASPHDFDVPKMSRGVFDVEPYGFYAAVSPEEALRSAPTYAGRKVSGWSFKPAKPFVVDSPQATQELERLWRESVQDAKAAIASAGAIPDADEVLDLQIGVLRAEGKLPDGFGVRRVFTDKLLNAGYDAIVGSHGQYEGYRVALKPEVVAKSQQMRPEMSRTTALPKPQLHAERFQQAARRVDELLGRDATDWDKAPEWLDEARQLPKLQKELAELRGQALDGDYAKSLPEQEVAIELQLKNALKAREEYAARKQTLDARNINARDEYLPDKEIDELSALRNEALSVPLWRARLKRVQERIAKGEREIFPAEEIADLQAQVGAAEVAAAKLEALAARAKDAKYFIEHARKVPQEALEKGHRFYGNTPMHDAAVQSAKDIEDVAYARQAHKVYAGQVERLEPGAAVDPMKLVPWAQAARTLGIGRTATEQANAIRAFAEELKRYGKISEEEFQNIAGPHAVATSAVKQDPVLAQELRKAELEEFGQRITGEYEKRVKLLQSKFKGAELDKQLADLESRFKDARTKGIDEINAKKLTDTSHAGRLMQVKRDMHQKLYAAADEARLSGQLDDEAYRALRAEADDWLKGKTKGTNEAVQQFQRLWEQAVAADPIPNDGLLLMRSLYVPKETVDALARAKSFRNNPAEEGFGYWADWWRRLTKGHFTMPFANFHIRNGMNMGYQYGAAGVRDPRHGVLRGFAQPWLDAWNVLQGKKVGDFDSLPAIAAMGLKGDEAERQLIAAAESYAGLKGAGDIISEGYEKGVPRKTAPAFMPFGKQEHDWGTTAEMFTAGLPGGQPLDLKYLLEPLSKKHGASRFNPANVEQFAPIALGARFSNTTENVGRLATFIGLLRQGKSFEEAGALVKAMHVDYSDLTAFERNVARRVIPFYSWSRHMIPYTLRQFAEKPAGVYAQTARLARVAEQDAGFLPPQLGGSLAIPIGQEENGTQRYLSQFDTPAESLNRIINPASLGDTVRSVLAQSDPVMKFFIEQGTGKQLFRGRNLEDLESTTGRLAANLTGADEPLWRSNIIDNILANSPASRYVGTLTQAGDDRKSWPDFLLQQGTGVRLTDVDVDKAKSIAAGKAARELLKDLGARSKEVLPRISKEDLAKLSPEDRAEAERLQAILDLMAKRRRSEKK